METPMPLAREGGGETERRVLMVNAHVKREMMGGSKSMKRPRLLMPHVVLSTMPATV